MNKRFVLLLTLMLLTTVSFSQNEYLNYKYSIATNAHFRHSYNSNPFLFNPVLPPLPRITASLFVMDGSLNQHELSIEQFKFSVVPDQWGKNMTRLNRSAAVSIGYKYHFNFIKKKNSRWIPSVGIGAHLVYRGNHSQSISNFRDSNLSNSIGLEHYVQPALTFHANKRLYVNLALPFNLFSTTFQFKNRNGSSYNPGNSSNSTNFYSRTGLNYFQAKLGLGIKL